MVHTLRPKLATLRGTGPKPLQVSESIRPRGRAWLDLRAAILARDAGLCQACKRAGRLRLARDVDHIEELADGGAPMDPANLESVCGPCHDAKSAAARRARFGQG